MTFRERMQDGTIRVTGTQVSSGGGGPYPLPSLEDLGLENVDNTSDADKPISTATQLALNAKANDNEVVKLTGNQTIQGIKKFDNVVALEKQTANPSPLEMEDVPLLFAGNNGLPYWRDGGGIVRPIITPREAVHDNPNFEDWSGSGDTAMPVGWSRFWMTSTVTTQQDTTAAVSGASSLKIVRPSAAGTASFQTTAAYGCLPGDQITFEFYAKASSASSKASVSLWVAPESGDPGPFGSGAVRLNNQTDLTTEWKKYSFSWTVPTGMFQFRFAIDPDSTNGTTMTFWFDDTGSTRTTPQQVAFTMEDVRDLIYPVGAIFMSTSPVNPETYLGGTWQAWGSGRVPVGVNTSESEFNTVEKTGGAKTHTLTVDQMPSHSHSINHGHTGRVRLADDAGNSGATADKGTAFDGAGWSTTSILEINPYSGNSGSAGSGQAHNNLQPYITCYMWKRTA